MRVTIIAAMSRNRVIGWQTRIPWHLPEDLKHFKQITLGHTLVMGRVTFESIRRPLPGRATIVVTRQPGYQPAGVLVAHSVDEALRLAEGEELFIAGGAMIYEAALPLAGRILLTVIEADYEGDAFFPAIDPARWRQVTSELHPATDVVAPWRFVTYEVIPGLTPGGTAG